jgi:hypothetical protein
MIKITRDGYVPETFPVGNPKQSLFMRVRLAPLKAPR